MLSLWLGYSVYLYSPRRGSWHLSGCAFPYIEDHPRSQYLVISSTAYSTHTVYLPFSTVLISEIYELILIVYLFGSYVYGRLEVLIQSYCCRTFTIGQKRKLTSTISSINKLRLSGPITVHWFIISIHNRNWIVFDLMNAYEQVDRYTVYYIVFQFIYKYIVALSGHFQFIW